MYSMRIEDTCFVCKNSNVEMSSIKLCVTKQFADDRSYTSFKYIYVLKPICIRCTHGKDHLFTEFMTTGEDACYIDECIAEGCENQVLCYRNETLDENVPYYCKNHIKQCVSFCCFKFAYGGDLFCENHDGKCYALTAQMKQCKHKKKMGDFCTRHENNRPRYTIDVSGNTDYVKYQ